jgi:WD40 repeat protein
MCVRWSPDAQYLAAGGSDGVVRVYNSKGAQAYQLNESATLPTTCVRFRPLLANTKTKNVLITASTPTLTVFSFQLYHL